MRRLAAIASLAVVPLTLAATFGPGAHSADAVGPSAAPCSGVNCLRINQLQMLSTHNSYHVQPEPDVLAVLNAFDPTLGISLAYTHPALSTQLGFEKVRHLELDVYADPSGGLYYDRHILSLFGRPTASKLPALKRPGLKVMHVQDVDYRSQCLTFVLCLTKIKEWSDAHPIHLPIAIQVEVEEDKIPDPVNLGFVVPPPFDATQLDEIDTEIRSVFAPSEVITPDDVRHGAVTLDAAVKTGKAWPTVAEARGKVMFLLDNEAKRNLYLQGHPALAGRMLFTPSSPGQPDAAFIKDNDPVGNDGLEWQRIQGYVASGYMVRTRADADTLQARANDTSTRDAALRSGAQWVSTDYPSIHDNPFHTPYFVSIPGGGVARCNPISSPRACAVRYG